VVEEQQTINIANAAVSHGRFTGQTLALAVLPDETQVEDFRLVQKLLAKLLHLGRIRSFAPLFSTSRKQTFIDGALGEHEILFGPSGFISSDEKGSHGKGERCGQSPTEALEDQLS